MSRGFGREQRRVLHVLTGVAQAHGPAYVLLRSLARQEPTFTADGQRVKVNDSAVESTRRAVRTLVTKGLVESRTTTYGGRKHKVVRLRPTDDEVVLPTVLDEKLRTELEVALRRQNAELRRWGSRYRYVLVRKPHMESAKLFNPTDPNDLYESIYLYPEESPRDPTWVLKRAAELFAQADRHANNGTEAATARSEITEGSTTAGHIVSPHHPPVEKLSDQQLFAEIARLLRYLILGAGR